MSERKVSRRLLFVTSIPLLCSFALSQGEFLRKGESGAGLSSGFTTITSDGIGGNSVGVSVGYSFATVVDVNVGYARWHPPDAEVIAPSISYFLSKQSKEVQETFALSILLQHVSTGSQSQNENNLGFGLSFAHSFFYDSPFVLQLGAGFVVYPVHSQHSETATGVSAGMSVGARSSGGHYFVLTPSVGYQSDNVSVGLSFVFIANLSPLEE